MFQPIGYSLICRCIERINMERTYKGCHEDGYCNTNGVCYLDFRVIDHLESNKYRYGCLDNDFILEASIINSTCSRNVVNSKNALLCCDDTDYCNDHLRPEDLLFPPSSMALLSPSPTISVVPTVTPDMGNGENSVSVELLATSTRYNIQTSHKHSNKLTSYYIFYMSLLITPLPHLLTNLHDTSPFLFMFSLHNRTKCCDCKCNDLHCSYVDFITAAHFWSIDLCSKA